MLVKILTEPKNALCKQYHKLLEYDSVELSFDVRRAGGHRGDRPSSADRRARSAGDAWRSIMTKIMYEIPSDPTIQSVLITEDCVRNGTEPVIKRDASRPREAIRNAGMTL